MKRNRLEINMRNKIDILHGAIRQCHELMDGKTIELKGINPITIGRGDTTDEQFTQTIGNLYDEIEGLEKRLLRMGCNLKNG